MNAIACTRWQVANDTNTGRNATNEVRAVTRAATRQPSVSAPSTPSTAMHPDGDDAPQRDDAPAFQCALGHLAEA